MRLKHRHCQLAITVGVIGSIGAAIVGYELGAYALAAPANLLWIWER